MNQSLSTVRKHFGRNARRYVAGSTAAGVVASAALGGWIGLAISAPLAALQVWHTRSHSDYYIDFTRRSQIVVMAIAGPFSFTLLPTIALKAAEIWHASPPPAATQVAQSGTTPAPQPGGRRP